MRRTSTLAMRQGVLDRGRVVRNHNDRVLSTALLGGGKPMQEQNGVITVGTIKPNFRQRYAVYSGGGICPTIIAGTYKNGINVLVEVKSEGNTSRANGQL